MGRGGGKRRSIMFPASGRHLQAMQGDATLIQLFAPSRTYAIGSQCLLELLEDRIARQGVR
jgi:hypothetical protein